MVYLLDCHFPDRNLLGGVVVLSLAGFETFLLMVGRVKLEWRERLKMPRPANIIPIILAASSTINNFLRL